MQQLDHADACFRMRFAARKPCIIILYLHVNHTRLQRIATRLFSTKVYAIKSRTPLTVAHVPLLYLSYNLHNRRKSDAQRRSSTCVILYRDHVRNGVPLRLPIQRTMSYQVYHVKVYLRIHSSSCVRHDVVFIRRQRRRR